MQTQIVGSCSRSTLHAISQGKVDLSPGIHADGGKGCNGLVDAGFAKHYRSRHQDDHFAQDSVHINGIESVWRFSKRRLARFNGVPSARFPLFLKEGECRFSQRHDDLYRRMLASVRHNPPGTSSGPDSSVKYKGGHPSQSGSPNPKPQKKEGVLGEFIPLTFLNPAPRWMSIRLKPHPAPATPAR